MKKLLRLSIVAIVLAAATPMLAADYLLSNFSTFSSQDPTFEFSWSGGSPAVPQYTQNTNFISITPVNGGNPRDDGIVSVAFSSSENLTGLNYVSLTARVDAGNATSFLKVRLLDDNFNAAEATFATSDFGSAFSNKRVELIYSIDFNAASVIGWQMAGGNFLPQNDFRMSFDELSLTDQLVPIPEPTLGAVAWILAAAGFASVRRRRSQRTF